MAGGSRSSYFGKRAAPAATPSFLASSSSAASSSAARQGAPAGPSASFEQYRLPRTVPAPEQSSGTAFNAYSLPASQGSPPRPQRTQRTAEQQARHEAFQRIVDGPGLKRRRSLVLDEAAAAEARRAAGEESGEEGADTPDIEENAVGANLRSKYAAPEKPAKRGRKKKEEELGPSGMTYTPLEKQFMEIKAKWPDVLLMTEGELPQQL